MYNYTFIIPHKNTPTLLQRCIDSIPVRDDIQLIIIDDNSDESLCDNVSFPGINRKNTQVIFTKEGLGAGYVRNVGLQHAKGKWVLFADADDYYTKNFIVELDRYVDSNIAVVYFSITSDDYIVPQIAKRLKIHHKCIEKYCINNQGSADYIKYLRWEPWNKMISKKYIDEHCIRFEEIKKSNDMVFCLLVSLYAGNNIAVLNKPLYSISYQKNSLTYGHTNSEAFIYNIRAIKKKNLMMKYIGHGDWAEPLVKIYLYYIKKDGMIHFIRMIRQYLNIRNEIKKDINKFKEERLCKL